RGERVEVESARVLMAAREVDREDLAPLLGFGQVDEEHLVEAALPQELGRGGIQVVGGGGDEHRGALLLKPGEKGAEKAPSEPGVRVPRGAGREGFLDLVDPEHGGCDRLGGVEGAPELAVGLSDVLVEEPSGVELEKR